VARFARRVSISLASPKPFKMTLAPPCASVLAMPRPMPLVDPVTKAVLRFMTHTPLECSIGRGARLDQGTDHPLGRATRMGVAVAGCGPVAALVMLPSANLQRPYEQGPQDGRGSSGL